MQEDTDGGRDVDTDQAYDRTFGARLRDARDRRGWSQRQLADELLSRAEVKLDPSAVTRIERGTREVKLREAVALATVLKVPLQDLVEPSPANSYREIVSSLQSASERRQSGREAIGGMSLYYASIISNLDQNPDLLEQLGAKSVEHFLVDEVKRVFDANQPQFFLRLSPERYELVQKLVKVSTWSLIARDPRTVETQRVNENGERETVVSSYSVEIPEDQPFTAETVRQAIKSVMPDHYAAGNVDLSDLELDDDAPEA